jgi:hypothetical protein
MPLSMHQASIPAFVQMLNNLSAILGRNFDAEPEIQSQ